MKRLPCFVFLFFVLVISSNAQKDAVGPQGYERFDPSGDYHPLVKPTVGDERFIQFDLRVKRTGKKLVASGEIRGVGSWYRFQNISITETTLRFETETKAGVRYVFDGRFLSNGNFANQSVGRGDLRLDGSLKKLVNGLVVLDTKGSFLYYPGC